MLLFLHESRFEIPKIIGSASDYRTLINSSETAPTKGKSKGKRIRPEGLFHRKWNFLNFLVIYELLLLQYHVIAGRKDRKNNEQRRSIRWTL